MNERKQAIRDLLDRRKEYLNSLDLIWEQLGELLLEQNKKQELKDHAGHEISEYSRLKRDINESESNTSKIKNILQHIQTLKENEHTKNKTKDRLLKEMENMHIDLGRAVLDDISTVVLPSVEPYAQTRELILSKIRDLELLCMQQETEEASNYIKKLGKKAKLLFNKSFLSRQKGELDHLYTEVGKIASGMDLHSVPAGISVQQALDVLEKHQTELNTVMKQLNDMFNERKNEEAALKDLNNTRSASGQIVVLERKIEDDFRQLKLLCRRFGQRVTEEHELFSDSKKQSGAAALCKKAAVLQDSIQTSNAQIQKLEAEIQIMLIQSEVQKLYASISTHEHKIEEENKIIQELKQKITESEHEIKELSKM